ncbi:hypothetical protein Bca52824_056566 [Brassica carinata]|uniref:NPH3 domain-containing protein n=1 Tax=Brassica carinata TaxID=52824 RepID=A0A8X7UFE9_BRACI|nr:hypothetical protein Bca52824_056566 [Brassica carinata]
MEWFIQTVASRGVKADLIAASVTHYAKRNLPLLGCSRHCGSSSSEEGTNYGDDIYYSHDDQRSLLEEIVELLPSEKRVASTRFLLRLLRTSMVLHASAVTQDSLERKIGVQLDEAGLEDLLIPNMGYSAETLYDIDSVQRILDHFMLTFDSSSRCYNNVEEKQLMGDSDHPLRAMTKSTSGNWWFNDVSSFLDFPLYKRFIQTVASRGVKADVIAASVTHYAKRNLPLLGCSRHVVGSSPEEASSSSYGDDVYYSHDDQRSLLEEIVELLPSEKRVTSTRFLLRLLRTSMVLHASAVTQDNLERKIGSQLDEAALEDLLIPNMGYSAETLYDIDSVQRILDHFIVTFDSYSNVEEKQLMGDSDHPLRSITKVASLIDGYLAEVGSDENLKVSKFQALGALIPEDVRPMDDGIYRAIDIFIKDLNL